MPLLEGLEAVAQMVKVAHTGCAPLALLLSPQVASRATRSMYTSPSGIVYDSFTPSGYLAQKSVVEPRNGLFLHGWHDVGVDIHGHTNLRVS
jgi:hypothetical protein